jgi:hypothetical protein
VIAGHDRRPFRKDPHKAACRHVVLHQVLGQIRQTETGQGGVEDQRDRVERQWPFNPNLQLASVLNKRSGPEAARRGQSQIDAGVVGEVVGRAWPGPPGEVRRRADESLMEVRPNP